AAWRDNRARHEAAQAELDAARECGDDAAVARLVAEIDDLDDTERPSPVMVWTPEQTGQFLDFISDDRLYPLYHLIAYRGPRRGEACGVRWTDLNRAFGHLTHRRAARPTRLGGRGRRAQERRRRAGHRA